MIWLSSDLRFKWFWLSIELRFNWLVVNWFEIQMIWLSIDVCFKWFCLSVDLNFEWCGCQLVWDSIDLVVNQFEIQMIWLSADLRFKWVGCQWIWDSNELVVNWFEIQVIWMSNDLKFKWFGSQLMCDSNDFVKRSFSARLPPKRRFEAQKRSISARLPSKTKLWRSKMKLLCETSFKNEALKIKNEAFVRDFLQKRSFEDQKRSFCARRPSKTKLWRPKAKLLCETSFNEAFLRDFLQKWHKLTRHLTSEFQYVLTIFKRTLQKYCACHEKKLSRGIRSPVTATRNDHCKVTLPWHEICNPSTDSASEASNIDITKREIMAPATRNASFRSLFKSTTPANVFATLTNPCACQFCNLSKSLRLPREKHFERPKTSRDRQFLTIVTSESLSRAGVVQILQSSTSKSAPTQPVFNDFWLPNRSRAQAWCKFCRDQFRKVLRRRQFLAILTSESLSRAGVVQIFSSSTSKSAPSLRVFNDFDFRIALARRRDSNFVGILGSRSSATPVFRTYLASFRSDKSMEKHSLSRNSYPPKSLVSRICAVKHLCCPTSMLRDLPASFSRVGS